MLVRQRPGTAAGVCFITIEDETGIANLVVFQKLFEYYRKEILRSRLLMVEGKLQREGEVTHVIVQKCYNLSHLLVDLVASPEDVSNVSTTSLYGSYSNGTAGLKSDIDLVLELDYAIVENKPLDFLAIAHDLTNIVGINVSITTLEAFSAPINRFVEKGKVIVIYDIGNNIEYSVASVGSFTKKEYRDRAILEHMLITLKLIEEYDTNTFFPDDKKENIVISACLNEISKLIGLSKKLTPNTLDELLDFMSKSSTYGSKFFSLLKNLNASYFGIDKKIVRNIVQHELQVCRDGLDELLGPWNSRFKNRLRDYFVNILTQNVNSHIVESSSFSDNMRIIELAIGQTLEKILVEELNPNKITEGERNIKWFAYQLNGKKIWDGISDIICPFFPFC